uniref:RING-type domain-containing protein n=1 Tax=Terrapene triunguis TaxID=2587831 RepID=A0A674JTQ9_9SAUR
IAGLPPGMYPVNELRDELVCPICLESFKDPVILDCGHNYCQACITDCWGASGTGVCPQCRKPLPEGQLRPNKHLEAVADIARDLQGECKKHQEVLKFFCPPVTCSSPRPPFSQEVTADSFSAAASLSSSCLYKPSPAPSSSAGIPHYSVRGFLKPPDSPHLSLSS